MNALNTPPSNIGSRTATGASILIASRLITRCIDFVALIVLARLLSLEDFGVVAIAMSIVMIVEAIMELSLGLALVAIPVRTSSHYDTVFTLQLLRGLILASVLLISSWPLSQIYHDHRLIPLICVLSIAPASRGLSSPRMMEFSIAFNFWPTLVVEVIGKLSALALSVSAALLIGNYWALAISTIASPITMLFVSYVYAPYLPKISLKEWRDFAGYVRWATIGQTINALVWQMDPLMLGHVVDHFSIGAFSMASNLVALPTQIFVVQVMQPLVVAFSSVREDLQRLTAAYQKSAISIVTLSLPIVVGMSICAEPLLRLAFGEKWLASTTILRWLLIAAIPSLFVSPLSALALSVQKVRFATRLTIIELLVKFPLMLIGLLSYGIPGVLGARLITASVMGGCAMLTVRELIGLRIRDQLLATWRPVMSTVVMTLLVVLVKTQLGDGQGYNQLIFDMATIVGVGVVAYAGSMFFLWDLAGRPDGIECKVASLLGRSVRRITSVSP